jgi:CDP-glucose 4,6-dehydratase
VTADALNRARPDIIFHLAAQPIVRTSLTNPRETFDVNVMGTVSVLDAVRSAGRPCVVVAITSDKCYRNDGQIWGFRENDPLGGHDPYSASKAGSELVVDAYRASFFAARDVADHGVRLASARAGNVLGGGDWAEDRIVPDAARALSLSRQLVVRNPTSTRPWQHVLEPLSGYLTLGARMLDPLPGDDLESAWNFGPSINEEATVAKLADAVIAVWGSGSWTSPANAPHNVEAKTLRIAIDKAVSTLGWRPRWDFDETIRRTMSWYRTFYQSPDKSTLARSLEDIEAYEAQPASTLT